MLALTAAICVESIFGVYLGYSWEDIEEYALKGIGRVNQTVIVMILIGMLIGVGFPPEVYRPCYITESI